MHSCWCRMGVPRVLGQGTWGREAKAMHLQLTQTASSHVHGMVPCLLCIAGMLYALCSAVCQSRVLHTGGYTHVSCTNHVSCILGVILGTCVCTFCCASRTSGEPLPICIFLIVLRTITRRVGFACVLFVHNAFNLCLGLPSCMSCTVE